jgi:flavin-binding protein dodecin
MPNSVFKKIELVGCSPTSISEAISSAIAAAAADHGNLGWFEVTEIRGNIRDGRVSQYQVSLRVGCKITGGGG